MHQHTDQGDDDQHQGIEIGNLKAEADGSIADFQPFEIIPAVISGIPQPLNQNEKRQGQGQHGAYGAHQDSRAFQLLAEGDENQKGHQRKHGDQPGQL
ncbi:hypothetical protein D3C72_2143190 [compost metagenome]